jgi:hypothetical protein
MMNEIAWTELPIIWLTFIERQSFREGKRLVLKFALGFTPVPPSKTSAELSSSFSLSVLNAAISGPYEPGPGLAVDESTPSVSISHR